MPGDAGAEEERPGVLSQLYTGLFTNNPKFWQTFVYLIFVMAFFWAMMAAQGGSNAFEMVDNIRNLFGDFVDVSDHSSWFDFMENTFPDVVFPGSYYNGEKFEDEHLGNVGTYFMLIGAVGVRQVRAKNNTCGIDPTSKISPFVKNCFGEYNMLNNEDTMPYGPPVEPGTGRKFQYSTAAQLGCNSVCTVTGNLNTYGGGGFFKLLPSARLNSTNELVATEISQLKTDRYLDRQTRAVFVDLVVFNLPTKLLASVQLWYEVKASGNVKSYIQVIPLKMGHLYLSESNMSDLLSEFILLGLTVFYTFAALREWFRQGCLAYWSNGWNDFDIINYVCMFAAFGMRFLATAEAPKNFPPKDTEFVYISAAAGWIKSYKYALGFNCIFTFFKILKYLSHIPMFARLVKILGACMEDVGSFLINCFISFMAFAGAFHLTYGNHMIEFATINESFMTLYRMSMGDWDVQLLQSFQPDIGIFYFMCWSLLAICLLLNMFVAIIMESYDTVNQEEEKIPLSHYIKKSVYGDDVEVVVSNEKVLAVFYNFYIALSFYCSFRR